MPVRYPVPLLKSQLSGLQGAALHLLRISVQSSVRDLTSNICFHQFGLLAEFLRELCNSVRVR